MSCVAHSCARPYSGHEKDSQATLTRKGNSSSVFYIRWTSVPVAWRISLAVISHSTLPHVPHSLERRPERNENDCIRGEVCCGKTSFSKFRSKEAEQEVGGTRGTNKEDKYDKEKRKNKADAAGSSKPAEDSKWTVIAAGIS